MREKIQGVFFDIDGTLYDLQEGKVLPATIEAVKQLQEKGIKAAIASARPLSTTLSVAGLYDIKWDGIICCNGQDIWKNPQEKIMDNGLKTETMDAIFDIAKVHHIPMYSAGDSSSFYTMDNHLVQEFIAHYHLSDPIIKPYEHENNHLITILHEKDEDVRPYFSHISDIVMIDAWDVNIDIFKKDVNKASGCQDMMRYWGLEKGNYLSFGDAFGDIPMLKDAKIGVAMHHAAIEVKQAANAVCDSIASFLKENQYIE